MKPRVILINGPPSSGKDTVGRMIEEKLGGGLSRISKFARQVKERTHAFYELVDLRTGKPERHNAYDVRKDDPLPEFWGLSPRQAYIEMSERYTKAVHGKGIWGILLLHDLRTFDALHKTVWLPWEENKQCRSTHIITDCGFLEEVEPLVGWYGAENLVLLRLFREGKTFEKDSRGYLDVDMLTEQKIRYFDISVIEGLQELRKQVAGFLEALG